MDFNPHNFKKLSISVKRYHNQHAIQESDTDQWSNSLNLSNLQSSRHQLNMEPVDTEGAGLKVESYREFPEVVDFTCVTSLEHKM